MVPGSFIDAYAELQNTWVRYVKAFPAMASVVLQSKHDVRSFLFLRWVFHNAVESHDVGLHILKAAVVRSFGTMEQFENVHTLLNKQMLACCPSRSGIPVKTTESIGIVVNAIKEMPHMNAEWREDPDSLVFVNMQGDENNLQERCWEELIQIMHASQTQTTSELFRRHNITLASVRITQVLNH